MIRKLLLIISILSLYSISAFAIYNENYYSKLTVIADVTLNNGAQVSVSDVATDSPLYDTTSSATKNTNIGSLSLTEWSGPESDTHTYFIFAKSDDANYVFDKWEVTSGAATISDANNMMATVTIIASKSSTSSKPISATITARFKERAEAVVVAPDKPSIGSASVVGDNVIGGTVTVKAEKAWVTGRKALNGYRCANAVKFLGWFDESGECVSEDMEYTFDVTKRINLIARFNLDLALNKDNYNNYFRLRYYSCDHDYLSIITDYAPEPYLPTSWVSLSEYIGLSLSLSDPANILQFTGKMSNANDASNFDYEPEKKVMTGVSMLGQGSSTKDATGETFDIRHTAQPGLYKFTYTSSIFTLVLKANEHSMPSKSNPLNGHGGGGVEMQFGVGLDHAGEDPDYQSYFEMEPIDEAHIDEFYFGAKADEDMWLDGGYWTSMYTAFPYQCWAPDGVEAYYVKNLWNEGEDPDEVIAEVVKIEDGKVPANTAVLLKCQGLEPIQNRLLPLTESVPAITDNLLKGSFQLNSKTVSKTTFSSASMRVLSVIEGGEPGFYNLAEGTPLTANKAWLDISSLTNAASKKIVMRHDYSGVEDVVIEEPSANDPDAPMYNLMGQPVVNPAPGTIYIQNGRKHIAR